MLWPFGRLFSRALVSTNVTVSAGVNIHIQSVPRREASQLTKKMTSALTQVRDTKLRWSMFDLLNRSLAAL